MCLCKTNIIQYNQIFVTQISIVFGLQKIQNHSGGTAYYLYSSACFSMNILYLLSLLPFGISDARVSQQTLILTAMTLSETSGLLVIVE